MKYFIFRNHTVEHLFKGINSEFSHYGDINLPQSEHFDAFVWFYATLPNPNNVLQQAEIEGYFEKLSLLISQQPKKRFIVFLLSTKLLSSWSATDRRLIDAVQGFNQSVIELSQSNSSVQFIDFENFTNCYSAKDLIDWKFYYISDIVISPRLAKDFQAWWALQERILNQKRKKCLVLDLDNTLWGGILGEDGMEGIKIGDTYPGRAFSQFQKNLLEANQNGVILTVCSKNNEQDVEEVWAKNPFIVLKKEHLATYRINWQNKVQNVIEIAEELNIGLDSIVFIDDNPAEREMVRQNIPEVIVPEFPTHPYDLATFFQEIYQTYFTAYRLTAEDLAKTGQYLENTQRKIFKQQFVNIDDYLSSLNMELSVNFADRFNTVRIAQMTQKTNQFNLTTRRYTEADINTFLSRGALVACLSVKDKFGDNGITVAAIIDITLGKAHFDSYLLSCRILGRGIEKAFIYYLFNILIQHGIREVTAEYIPTGKNRQTQKFYESVGFNLVNDNDRGVKFYEITLSTQLPIPNYYHFVEVVTEKEVL